MTSHRYSSRSNCLRCLRQLLKSHRQCSWSNYFVSRLLNIRTWRVFLSPFPAYVSYHGRWLAVWSNNPFSQVTFTLTPNAQILPRILNSLVNGTAGNIYLIVSDIGRKSGSGINFLLGQTFLGRFYSVYDTANARIGLATTPFTDATTNWSIPHINIERLISW